MTFEPLSSRIQRALSLPPEAVHVQRIGVAARPLVTLVDPVFEAKNELERQRDVRHRLQAAGIDPNELGFIVTNTPEEEAAMRHDVLEEAEAEASEAL